MDPILPPDVLEEDTPLEHDQSYDGDEEPKKTKPKQRRKPRQKRTPVETQPTQSTAPVVSLQDARNIDYETWVEQYDWTTGLYSMKLERLTPAVYKTVTIKGFMPGGERTGDYFREAEIQQLFGGGKYEAKVIGPSAKDGKRRMINRKQVEIAGNPRMTFGGLPTKVTESGRELPSDFLDDENGDLYGPPPRRSRRRRGYDPYADAHAEPVQEQPSQVLGLLGDTFSWMKQQATAPKDDGNRGREMLAQFKEVKETYEGAAERREQGAEKLLREKDLIVDEQKAMAQKEVQEAQRREREAQEKAREALERTNEQVRAAQAEIKAAQAEKDQLRAETAERQQAMTEKMEARIHDVQSSGNELLIALLTNSQSTSAQQLNTTIQAYDQRLAAADTAHQMALSNLTTSYENRLRALETFFQSQSETAKQMNVAREQQLITENTSLREEVKRVRDRLDAARDQLMTEIQRVAKTNDPIEQLGKMEGVLGTLGGIREALGADRGGGGGTGAVGEGLDSPALQMVAQLGDKLLNVVPIVADAWAASKSQPPPRAMPPQRRPGPPQQRQGIPPAPAGAPALPAGTPTPPKPPPKPQTRVSKTELQKAIFFINNVLGHPPAPPPEELARGALSVVDNAVLTELAKRRPDRVVAELSGAGILNGQTATPEGQQYLEKLLMELRKLLIEQPTPTGTVSTPAAQPPATPPAEPLPTTEPDTAEE